MISARRINALRAFFLMIRMEDEIDLLRARPLWATSKSAFGIHVALQQLPNITIDAADGAFDRIKALIDARVRVLRRRQEQLNKRYQVDKILVNCVSADAWIDVVQAMAQ